MRYAKGNSIGTGKATDNPYAVEGTLLESCESRLPGSQNEPIRQTVVSRSALYWALAIDALVISSVIWLIFR